VASMIEIIPNWTVSSG